MSNTTQAVIDFGGYASQHDRSLHPETDRFFRERSVFETGAYRSAYGMGRVLRVDTGAAGFAPLHFEDRGDHAVCLARTATLDAPEVEAVCDTLFRSDRIRFVEFDSIAISGRPGWRPSPLIFCYQNDWVVPLDEDAARMPGSVRRKIASRLSRLRREFDGISLEMEPSPSPDLVAKAIALGREKIEASGRTYLIDGSEQERLADLFGKIGAAAVLRHGSRVIACELFVEHGLECYDFMGGYDMDYARAGPGMIVLRHALDHYRARGFRSVHFLWGDGHHKADLGARPVPLTSMIVPRDSRAFANSSLLSRSMDFAKLHLRARVKERSWLSDPLRRALHTFRSVRRAF